MVFTLFAAVTEVSVIFMENSLMAQIVFLMMAFFVSWAMLWNEKMNIIWLGFQMVIALVSSYIARWDQMSVMFYVSVTLLSGVIAFSTYRAAIGRFERDFHLRRAERDADFDPLTGLYNRRGLEKRMETLWQTCSRCKISAGLIMMDIDDFKCYNDTFGHPQGDKCIRAVASQIKKNARRKSVRTD